MFFGYNPTGYSDDDGEGEGEGQPPPSGPTHVMPAESKSASKSAVVEAEAVEAVVVDEEPKRKCRKVKGTTKRPRHATARNQNHCEGSAHALTSRSIDFVFPPEQLGIYFYFYLFSFSILQILGCNPHLYHGHNVFSCV